LEKVDQSIEVVVGGVQVVVLVGGVLVGGVADACGGLHEQEVRDLVP